MGYFIDFIAIILILSGLTFFFGAAVGLMRLPDFYTRMHAAGKGDTLSTLLILAGFAIHELNTMGQLGAVVSVVVMFKILAICVFIMVTSPTSTHALMEAGYEDGIEPLIDKDGVDCLAEDFLPGQAVRSRPAGQKSREL